MNRVRSSTAGLATLYDVADRGAEQPHLRFRRQLDDAHRTTWIHLREDAGQKRRARLEIAGGVGGALPHRLHRLRGDPTAQPALGGLPGDAAGDTRNRQRGTLLCPSPPGRVASIGVDSNDSNGSAAQTLLAGARASYPVDVDGDATVATSYLLNALPVTYFLDSNGRVVHAAFGAQSLASLRHWAAVLTTKTATP